MARCPERKPPPLLYTYLMNGYWEGSISRRLLARPAWACCAPANLVFSMGHQLRLAIAEFTSALSV